MTITEEMKGYERLARTTLPKRSYSVIRVDGKAFHTFTRGMNRPYDASLANAMDKTAEALCKQVSGAIMAYTQSDEISVLVTDLMGENTQPWFGGQVQKITSVTASIATAAFNMTLQPEDFALFDSRVFTLPNVETVQRYFGWRQRDCVKNSISMTAQSHFSHKNLQSKSGQEMRDMLNADPQAPNWEDQPLGFRVGRLAQREVYEDVVTFTHGKTQEEITTPVTRSRWVTTPAKLFGEQGEWVGPQISA